LIKHGKLRREKDEHSLFMTGISKILSRVKEKTGVNLFLILSNVGWLSFNQFLRMGLSIFVVGWIGRYLGPDQFGVYNYILAFVSLFGTLTTLGLSGIVVRDLVRYPDDKNEILGTTFFLKLFGALIGFILITAIAFFVQRSDPKTLVYIMIYASGMLFQPFLVIDLWFQSHVKSKYVVIATSIAFFITSLLYIVMIITHQPLVAFVWVATGELVLDAIGLTIAFVVAKSSMRQWVFRLDRAKELLGQSWWLILSGIGAMINLKIDQVMLRIMSSDREVGIFAAAVRLSEVWYFVPSFVAASAFPALVRLRSTNYGRYQQRLQHLFDVLASTALLVAILGSVFSKMVIRLVYGEAYIRAGDILSVHIWAGIFVFMGEVLSKWLINENVLEFSVIRHGVGGLVNVLINLVLIPLYGGMGAAVATVISYATSSYLACFLYPKTREIAYFMTKALFSPLRWFINFTRKLQVKL
jgi:PST family polysaccharide transporter